jgi:ribosomal protein L31
MREYLHPVYVTLIVYILCATLTYGYAYNNTKETHPTKKVIAVSVSAMFWPLYVSVIIFEPKEVK